MLVTATRGTWVVRYRGALAGAAGWARMLSFTPPDGPPTAVDPTVSVMSDGWISYTGFDALDLQLGAGDDVLNVDSTPGPTSIRTGAGDDVVMIETLAAATTVDGQAGDDILVLNAVVLPDEASGLGGDVTLKGGTGSDYFVVGLWSQLNRTITIDDSVVASSGDTNVLIVNGTLAADTFLFRAQAWSPC